MVVSPIRSARDPRPIVVAVITVAVCAPFFRFVFWLGDEGVLLLGGERLLRGMRLYLDFFAFLPPGGYVLVAGWMKLLGASFGSVRALAVGTIAATASVTYLASRLTLERRAGDGTGRWRTAAACLAIGWAVWSQGPWTVVNHHWLTAMFSMGAAAAVLAAVRPIAGASAPRGLFPRTRQRRLALAAGSLAGVAALITPTRGGTVALAGLASLWLPRGRAAVDDRLAESAAFGAGLTIAPIATAAYLLASGTLTEGARQFLLFTAERYASIQSMPFGAGATVQSWPIVALFPLSLALFAAIVLRDRRAVLEDPVLLAAAAFSVAGLLTCFPRPDVTHVSFNAPLALPLFAGASHSLLARRSQRAGLLAAALALAVATPSALAYLAFARLVRASETTETPRGDVILGPNAGPTEVAPLLLAMAHIPREAPVFFYPYNPLLAFLANRPNAAHQDILTPGYTLPAQYREVCMERDGPRRVGRPRPHVDEPVLLKAIWPALPDASPPERLAFERAIEDDSIVVAVAGRFELRRLGGGGSAECDAIGKR